MRICGGGLRLSWGWWEGRGWQGGGGEKGTVVTAISGGFCSGGGTSEKWVYTTAPEPPHDEEFVSSKNKTSVVFKC